MKWWIWPLVLLSGESALAETPTEALLQAFKNAEAATHQRSDLTYTIDTASFRHVLTKVGPDRTHLVVTSASGQDQEAIVIGKTLYTRQNNTWTESPAPAQVGAPPNPAAGLQDIFASLTERPRRTLNGRAQRVFAGKVRWQAGRNFNEGAAEILIDALRTLPTRTVFKGQCGSRACTFTQTMNFSTSLTVTAPTVSVSSSAVVFFYSAASGEGATARVDGLGNYTFVGGISGLARGWTHVVGASNGAMLFYNASTGDGATARIDSAGSYQYVGSVAGLAKGWTHIVSASKGILLFFYKANGEGATARLDGAGIYQFVRRVSGFGEWTHICRNPRRWCLVLQCPNERGRDGSSRRRW